VDALLIALESTFVRQRAAGLHAKIELRLAEERFSVTVDDGTLDIARGSLRAPDAVIETEPATLRAVAFGDRKLADARMKIRGDARVARRFLQLFARPRAALEN